jgi:uncharacterized membrane protein
MVDELEVAVLVIVLAVVLLAFQHRRHASLEKRLRELESRVTRLDGAAVPPMMPPPLPSVAPPEPLASDAPPTTIEATVEEEAPRSPPLVPPIVQAPPQPVRERGFEETLGSRWAVWVGGFTLALGGAFLVRYSIEEGLIGPGVRVMLGLALALALMATGEWLRRREAPLAIDAFAGANIPAILTAAGTSTAFAAIYAAYGLYGLIGPGLAFLALGAISFVTMAAALLHGPALGALGLAAALGAPLLVETHEPSPFALVLYLAFTAGAAYGVARIRLWRWLARAAATGAILWGIPFILGGDAWQAGLVAHAVIQLALAILFLVVDPYRGMPPEEAAIDRMATIVLFWFSLLAIAAGADLGSGLARPVFAGIVVAMLVGAAMRYPAAAGALPIAGFAAAGTLALWPVLREAAREPQRIIPDLPATPYPEAVSTFIASAILLAAMVAGPGLLRLALGRNLRIGPAGWYAAGVTLTPLAMLVVAYWRLVSFDHSIPFAVVAGLLALGFCGATAFLLRQENEPESPALRLAVGAVASAAVAGLAAGLTFALDRGVLTIALALSALGTAVIADRLRLPALRWTVAAMGLAVAGRLAWDPSVMRGAIGTTPIFNWLLWGYGVPAAAFLAASRIMERAGRDGLVRFVESLGYVFAALLVFLEIRHALHAGDPFTARSSHIEAGLVVTQALGFTLLMVRLDLTRPDTLYRWASIGLGAFAILGSAVSLGLRFNPYLSHEPILGGALFNSLIPAYLLPAAMAVAVAHAARLDRPRPFVLAATGLAIALLLAYIALEIRRLFHPDGLVGFFQATGEAELWAYSAALVASGLGLLAFGILRGSATMRLAALACLGAAVLKVFLVDLSALEGLTRAFSFVGLGIGLLVLGFVYQRIVARP